ncbi:class I SAM-dependent methyltransferase, partial [Alphaproteobacteria bacterium]|nr:class I SAM-dependent methyltransferase [Alphaproteobacteria bacterium]
MLRSLFTIFKNSTRQGYFWVMLVKLSKRLEWGSADLGLSWASENAVEMDWFFTEVDKVLWEESKIEYENFKVRAKSTLSAVSHDLGGGGAVPMMYFLCRYMKPSVVVETGVAAGWTSAAFLFALDKEGGGKLFSSDFPYFRIKNPEQFIGLLVPEELKKKWVLDTRGDRVALPNILSKVVTVDLFHYDSDKSQSGKRFAYEILKSRMSPKHIIVFDDIQNDVFFKELADSYP